jgi:DNA-nicking Smr family endonuclease
MSRKKKPKPKKLPSLLVGESDDDEALFRAAVEQLDPHAVRAKLESGVEASPPAAPHSTGSAAAVREIDLHRCTVEEARRAIDAVFAQLVTPGTSLWRQGALVRLKIITGKGKHSGPAGPVLAREIHRYVALTYASHIVSIEESPADVVLGGLPLRGHFHVVLRR